MFPAGFRLAVCVTSLAVQGMAKATVLRRDPTASSGIRQVKSRRDTMNRPARKRTGRKKTLKILPLLLSFIWIGFEFFANNCTDSLRILKC